MKVRVIIAPRGGIVPPLGYKMKQVTVENIVNFQNLILAQVSAEQSESRVSLLVVSRFNYKVTGIFFFCKSNDWLKWPLLKLSTC